MRILIAQERNQKFVVESVDSDTLCIMNDVSFSVDEPSEFLSIIGEEPSPTVGSENSVYEIDFDQLRRLEAKYGFSLDTGDNSIVRVRPRHWLDELPYKVHTGRELALMLEGVKPLATFQVEFSNVPERGVFPEELFDRYVAEKKFVKHQYITKKSVSNGAASDISYRMVFYALKKEAWRINAFILLHQIATKMGWNDGFERMEGALLGYQDWECDEYFSLISKKNMRKPWSGT